MDIDFSGEDMMPISWGPCPGCRRDHHPDAPCAFVEENDDDEESEESE